MKIQNINDVESFLRLSISARDQLNWYLRKVTAST